jgi:DNA polymerase I-like protein with 3'-5' exonuclease and polymerase domains
MIINTDVKSLEWVTYLYLSQDKVGIEEWHGVVEDPTKNDIHRANETAFNLPSRLVAKVFLFRWIYRGSAYAYSVDPDFTPVSRKVEYWQDVIDRYYSKYKGLHATHLRYIQQVKDTGQLTSPFGRAYQFEKIKRRGEYIYSESDICNWINQGLGADVMAVARITAHQKLKRRKLRSLLVNTVHDSLVADSPQEEVDEVKEIFTEVFNELPKNISRAFNIEWTLPMIGETSVGPNMSDLS